MLRKTLAHIVLWLLFQLLTKINGQTTPFIPRHRYFHTATLIDNKLYILGGLDADDIPYIDESVGKEFFYLDFSAEFDIQNLSWKNLSSINTVPSHLGATSVKSGANNNTLFLYGGLRISDERLELIYTFDPQNYTWSTPKTTTGIYNIKKSDLMGISDYNGKIYLWGGRQVDGQYVNDMHILDTKNLSWGRGSLVGAPTPRTHYGAVLLPDNKIGYMGGYDFKELGLTLSQVFIYDTINDNWSTKTTTGTEPSNRHGFSAVLGLDGQSVIIFGGQSVPSTDTLYVLNLTNFEWSIPKISGQIPKNRSFHKANVIGKYMVISFGNYDGIQQSTDSDILLLDISNNKEFIWTNIFDPSASLTTSPTSSSSSNNKPAIIGAIIGSLIGLAVICFLLYKWRKNKQEPKTVIPTLGQENENKSTQPMDKNADNHGREIVQVPETENKSTQEPVNKNADNHEREIVQIPETENKSTQEPMDKNVDNQIIQIPENENIDNHEQVAIPIAGAGDEKVSQK